MGFIMTLHTYILITFTPFTVSCLFPLFMSFLFPPRPTSIFTTQFLFLTQLFYVFTLVYNKL